MRTPSSHSRRDALKASVLLGASTGLAASAFGKSSPTPQQTEGPFYPDLDNDLTFVSSRKERAQGDYIYVHGIVTDPDGTPIPNALVDIWQTDHQGIYDHAGDPNQKNKDKNFQSYGRFVTGEDGHYHFKSIKPRHYGDEKFLRTPHIHYKVARRGFHELTTQLYFDGEKLNAQDGIYNKLSADEQKLVTITFTKIDKDDKNAQALLKKAFGDDAWQNGMKEGSFDLVLQPV